MTRTEKSTASISKARVSVSQSVHRNNIKAALATSDDFATVGTRRCRRRMKRSRRKLTDYAATRPGENTNAWRAIIEAHGMRSSPARKCR